MFQLDYAALFIVLLCIAGSFYFSPLFRKKDPTLFVSYISSFSSRKKTFLERFARVPQWIFMGGVGSLLIALVDPHLLVERPFSDFPPTRGLAFYLILDRSGSMGEGVKFDRLKTAANGLIHSFPNDLIGVIAFARGAEVISPLTLDHHLLTKRIDNLSVISTPDQDGTSIGYAIYKTANLIAASQAFSQENSPYRALGAFMIIITDGLQDPSILDKGNPLRTMELEEAAAFAKEKKVKVFIVNIDPGINKETFAPNRRQMERITASTGGKFIVAERIDELETLLKQIPQKEMSQIQGEGIRQKRISFFPYLISLGLLLIGVGTILDQTIWKKAL